MRKHVSKRKKPEKSLFSMKRIFVISVILIVLSGMMGVMATNDKVNISKNKFKGKKLKISLKSKSKYGYPLNCPNSISGTSNA